MSWVGQALGRAPLKIDTAAAVDAMRERGPVLITGGLGSLGLLATDYLESQGVDVIPVDIDEMDVTDPIQTRAVLQMFDPGTILHLAGAKHAPLGELDPLEPVRVHVDGTRNVLRFAPEGCVVVTASTCKACDPETAYGASKLIAERLTLNAGQRVARFHNVVDTQGNVFELWNRLPPEERVPVADCIRHLICADEAMHLLLYAAGADTGRYSLDTGRVHGDWMHSVAARLYPTRMQQTVPARRGDRIAEPYCALSETASPCATGVCRVTSPHDPAIVECVA